MKKRIMCLVLSAMLLAAPAAFAGEQPAEGTGDWSREGLYTDENQDLLTITWLDEETAAMIENVDGAGWYVAFMNGDDWVEDCFYGILPQVDGTLQGTLPTEGSKDPLNVTVSEEGEEDLLFVIDGGETYHFIRTPDATIFVSINTEGNGNIAYTEGEGTPEVDPEYPYQSAQVNLAEPATHTFLAYPRNGSLFVKWTKNGEDFSTEPQITVLLDESAEYIAVFEEDPDWQNPVMNFIGEYQCGNAHALIECLGYDEAFINIEQKDSDQEMTNWVLTGSLNLDTLTIDLDGYSRTLFVYDENGEVVSDESEYIDAPSTVIFQDNGSFVWHREPSGDSEEAEDMVFEWSY